MIGRSALRHLVQRGREEASELARAGLGWC